MLFTNELVPGTIPEQLIPEIEYQLRAAARCDICNGFCVPDIQIALVDASFHAVDSTVRAFQNAAIAAFRDAVTNGGIIPDTLGDDRASGVREPRRPRPAPRDSAVAVPEPEDARGAEPGSS